MPKISDDKEYTLVLDLDETLIHYAHGYEAQEIGELKDESHGIQVG